MGNSSVIHSIVWGIFTYQLFCVQKDGVTQVCICTFDSDPPLSQHYTKKELEELAEIWRGVTPLYEEGLKFFAKECSDECKKPE